jgi:hypothetical protein
MNLAVPLLAVLFRNAAIGYRMLVMVAWIASFAVVLSFARYAVLSVESELTTYVAPRTGLFRIVTTAIQGAEASPVVSGLASLGGLLAAVLLIAQVLVFTASWMLVEVVLPLVWAFLVGPFLWFARRSRWERTGLWRYLHLFLWAVVAGLPGAGMAAAGCMLV